MAKQQAAAKLAAPMMAPEKPLHVEAIPHVSPKLPKAPKQSTAAHAAASLALHEGLGSWPPGCPPADPASKPWWEKCSRRAREQLSAVLGVEPASAQEWYEAVCASSPDAADLFLALQALVQDLVSAFVVVSPARIATLCSIALSPATRCPVTLEPPLVSRRCFPSSGQTRGRPLSRDPASSPLWRPAFRKG